MGSSIRVRSFSIPIIMIFSVFVSAAVAQEADVEKQIKDKISRLKRDSFLRTNSAGNDQLSGYQNRIRGTFTSAEQALESGYLYLGLNQLQEGWRSLRAGGYLLKKGQLGGSKAAFEREWRSVGKKLSEEQRRFDEAIVSSRIPAAVRASAEIARLKSQTYYQSSLRFYELEFVDWGLGYLGTSQALVEYALFCIELRFGSAPAPVEPGSLAPRLAQLEDQILRAYDREGAVRLQQYFNEANSALEFAGELDKKGLADAALMEYLTALMHAGVLFTAVPTAGELGKLKERCDEYAKRIMSGGKDYSIGRMFLERARNVLDQASGSSSNQIALLTAAVLIDKVLAAFFETVGDAGI